MLCVISIRGKCFSVIIQYLLFSRIPSSRILYVIQRVKAADDLNRKTRNKDLNKNSSEESPSQGDWRMQNWECCDQ